MPEVLTRDREDIQMETEREESFRDLLTRLANSSAALVRDELDLARQEVTEKLKSLRIAMVAIAAAAFIGLLAVMSYVAAAIAGLALAIGVPLAALVVGVALTIIAGIAGMAGARLLKKTKLKPEETIRTLKEDREWLKEMT